MDANSKNTHGDIRRSPCLVYLEYEPAGKNGDITLKAKFRDEVIAMNKVDLAKATQRKKIVDDVCDAMGDQVDRLDLEKHLLRIGEEVLEWVKTKGKEKPTSAAQSSAELLEKTPAIVREQARLMLESPDLVKQIRIDIEAMGVAGERELAMTVYMVGMSRLLSKPLSAISQGPTSTGKSYVIDRVAELMPPEGKIIATQMTPQALFYMKPGMLKNKFVVAGERSRIESDDTAEATRALREMQSSGRLSKLIPIKKEGEMVTELIEQDGPIAYIESTTVSVVFDEDANRCLLLNTDERPDQTKRIIKSIASHNKTPNDTIREQITVKHHALQRMIEPTPVFIPYAEALADKFKCHRVEARRAFPQALTMITTVALLHQRQRQVDQQGRIIATKDDCEIARHLLTGPLSRSVGGGLSDPLARFAERLKEHFEAGIEFSTREASKDESSSNRTVQSRLVELTDMGIVEQTQEHKGNRPAVWKRTGVEVEDVNREASPLPTTNALFHF